MSDDATSAQDDLDEQAKWGEGFQDRALRHVISWIQKLTSRVAALEQDVISGQISQAGTVTSGNVTVAKGATGIYDLTFPVGFQARSFHATASGGGDTTVSYVVLSSSAVRVTVYTGGVAANVGFSFLATA